jgi:hypothetical protein
MARVAPPGAGSDRREAGASKSRIVVCHVFVGILIARWLTRDAVEVDEYPSMRQTGAPGIANTQGLPCH